MNRRAIAAIFAILAYPAQTLAAPDSKGSFAVLGYGTNSCGTWTSEHQLKNDYAFAQNQWLLGYVTSFNAWSPGTSNASGDTDNAGLLEWVNNYCSQHPLNSISDAAAALMLALYIKQSPATKP